MDASSPSTESTVIPLYARLTWQQCMALLIVAFCFLALILALVLPKSGKLKSTATGNTNNNYRSSISGNRLAQLSLSGVIGEDSEDSVFSNPATASAVLEGLEDALNDNQVKGVLLKINSPGGTVTVSYELYRALMRLRQEKPVVVLMGDMAASGGYYTASAADHIVASPGTLTGSIGVILHAMNVEQLLKQKLGVQPVTIKSGQYKDILSPYRKATSADMAMLQRMINESYQQFITDVVAARTYGIKNKAQQLKMATAIKAVADGRIVLGSDAVHHYLVDSVGDSAHALDVLQTLAAKRFKLKHPEELPLDKRYGQGSFWQEMLGASSARFGQWAMPSASFESQALNYLGLKYANQPLWLMQPNLAH